MSPTIFPVREQTDIFNAYIKCKYIREFESMLLDFFSKGLLNGTTHTSIGQESNAVGVAAATLASDIFVSNHRCHGHLLAHVGRPQELLDEIIGHANGFCEGLGGSQHICIPNQFFSNGIQGGICALAAGLALGKILDNSKDVVCVFIGDGTLGEGIAYEAFNLIALLKLPVLIVVENNEIAQTTPIAHSMAGSIKDRFAAFDIPAIELTFPTPIEVFDAANLLVPSVRNRNPAALILKSTRLGPHSKGDDTRSAETLQLMKQNDPLARMEAELSDKGLLHEAQNMVRNLIDELSVDSGAKQSFKTPFESSYYNFKLNSKDFSEINGELFVRRINQGIHDFLKRNSKAFVLGEDITDPYGGAFKATKGLHDKFSSQVMGMPISEAAFTGMAGGASILGYRPIVEIMFGDFSTLILDQVINHISKYELMYAGQVTCPVIFRLPMGGGRGYGATHSQSLEKHLCGIPNLQVLALSSFIPVLPIWLQLENSSNPTVLIENKIDYSNRIDLEQLNFDFKLYQNIVEYFPMGCGNASMVIFCYGGSANLAMEASRILASEYEIEVRVAIIYQLHPLDIKDYLNASPKFSHAISVEEGSTHWGFGSEIASYLMSQRNLEGSPIKFLQLGALDTAIPASIELEKNVLPNVNNLVSKILSLSSL